ncbi:MAG: hypothetical protein ABH830_02230 [Patescibacteria group bacterium]
MFLYCGINYFLNFLTAKFISQPIKLPIRVKITNQSKYLLPPDNTMVKGINIKINHTSHCFLETNIIINNGRKKRYANMEFCTTPRRSEQPIPDKPQVEAGLNTNKYNLPNKEEKIKEPIIAAMNE